MKIFFKILVLILFLWQLNTDCYTQKSNTLAPNSILNNTITKEDNSFIDSIETDNIFFQMSKAHLNILDFSIVTADENTHSYSIHSAKKGFSKKQLIPLTRKLSIFFVDLISSEETIEIRQWHILHGLIQQLFLNAYIQGNINDFKKSVYFKWKRKNNNLIIEIGDSGAYKNQLNWMPSEILNDSREYLVYDLLFFKLNVLQLNKEFKISLSNKFLWKIAKKIYPIRGLSAKFTDFFISDYKPIGKIVRVSIDLSDKESLLNLSRDFTDTILVFKPPQLDSVFKISA